MTPAFIPASGLSSVSGTSVHRTSAVCGLSRKASTTTNNNNTTTPTMVSYPYTGSGYGGAGIPYANNKVGQFFVKTEAADIVDTLASISVFSTISSLLKSSGLDYELKKAGPFTLFAPTDDAFAALMEPHSFDLYKSLLRPENSAEIAGVLAYHVIPGELTTGGVLPFGGKITASTMNGDKITVMNYNRRVSAGTANVVRPDIECGNGIIHMISSVLTAPSYIAPPIQPPQPTYPNSLVSDFYGKMLTPRQVLGIDPAPEDDPVAAITGL